LSCRPFDWNDWMLNPAVFQQITGKARWGLPAIDLFATRLNHQVPRFFSFLPDPQAKGMDAFRQSWLPLPTQRLLWANPPWALIGRMLQKIIHDKTEIILIAPVWPTQAWYPTLLELLVAVPLLLPHWSDLFRPVSTANQTGKGPPRWAATAAWRLSGRPSRNEAFRASLQSTYYQGLEPPPPRDARTSHIGVGGWAGPAGGKWIPLGQL
jgi:hypothetical protein